MCTEKKKKKVYGDDNQKSWGRKINMKVPCWASENSWARAGVFSVF